MSGGKLFKIRPYLTYFFLAICLTLTGFLFFSCFKSLVRAEVADLPLNPLFTDCSVNPSSAPDDCRDAAPYGAYVDVSWNAQDCGGSCYYTVLRNGNVAVSNLTQTSYKDRGLASLTDYTYKVKAYNQTGELKAETSATAAKNITTKNCGCPNPFNLISTSNDCAGNAAFIKVSWPKVMTGSIESTLYEIYRWEGISPLNNYSSSYKIASISSAQAPYWNGANYSFEDSLIQPNTPYTYKVVAKSAGPARASANYLIQAAGPCPKPIITQLTTNEPDCSPQPRITLQWEDCVNSSDALQCKQSRGSYYYLYKNSQLIPIALGGDCLCGGVTQKCCQWQNDKYNCCSDDTTLVNNVTYNYHIESQGPYWTLRSNAQSRILSCSSSNVPRPDIFSVYPYCDGNAAKIILTWGYATGAPPEIQFYYVYKFQCASSDLNTCLPVDSFPYAITAKQYYVDSNNVNPGKYYLYYVKAATNSNISQATDSSLILVLDCPTTTYPLPVKPDLTIARQCYNSNPRLALSWTPLKTDDVYTYYIFKNGNILTNTSLNSYTDEAVAAGQSYNYIIETISKGGWVDSAPASATARADCDQPGPFVLNPLSAVCSDGKYNVTVSWSSSENASFYEIFSKFNDNTPPSDCDDTNGLIDNNVSATQYIHSGINQEGAHSYFVRAKITGSAKCAFASFSGNDNSITLVSPQPATPATPTAAANCNDSQSIINLSWPAVSGAISYKIYYTIDGAEPTTGSSNLDPGANTSYTHNVNPATIYRYKVQARSNCADSPLSDATNPITAIYCLPASFAITGSAACGDDNDPAYTISWTHSDSTVFRYDIYRDNVKIAEKTTSPFSPFGPDQPGQGSFTYYVKAINPAGARQSTNSYIANLDCSPPAAIANLAADPNVNCVSGYPVIKLTWTAPSGAVSYNIYRCQGCANPATQGAKIVANLSSASYNDTGGNEVAPLTGQTYSYQVETFKAANLSTSLSNLAQATARQCPLSSVTATLVSSCAANNKPIFTINWTAPAPVSQLDPYKIFRLAGQTASYGDFPATAFATAAASAVSWSDSAVENSAWYSYYVKANILDGRTVDSNIVSGNYNCQPPPAATLSQVNALCDAAGKLYVDLVWILDDKSNVSYYQVYRDSALLATINDKNQTTYQDWAVQNNQSYSYQIKACNSNNLCSESSILATTPNPTPYCPAGTPGNLVLTSNCILETPVVNLNWQSALNATKYKVVRDGNIIYADLSALAKMDDSGTVGGNTYIYQIIAENPDYLCDSCANCPTQCSSAKSITAPVCAIGNPQLFAQQQCVGNAGNQYGNYSHLYWAADETPGAPIWCRLEKEEAGNYAVKSLTFRSLGKYDSRIDNSSFTSQEITNSAYGAANEGSIYKSPSQSVRLAANSASSQPSYIGIYPAAFPGDGRDITLDFWFRLASFSCGDNTLRSLLWKDSGLFDAASNPLPDFRLSYNAQQNNEDDLASGSLVMLASAWPPSKIGETDKAVLKQGLNCDEWHHLIFTQNTNTADAQVYLDKNLVYQGNWSNNFTKTENLYLGSGGYHEPGTTNWFQVPQLYFDNIKIWPDKIISQRQVDKLFDTQDNQSYETFYDDFAVQEGGVYNYKVICHYVYKPSIITIIDNGDPGTSYTSAWYVSGGLNPYDTDSLWARVGAGTTTYTWTFTPSQTGVYELYMWWTEFVSRSTNVPVDIEYSGGATRVYVNQQLNGGMWNILGTYFFESGASYKVTVIASSSLTTCADAVKFVYTGISNDYSIEKTSQNSFNFNACPPDIVMPANDLQSVCSELEVKKFPDLAVCSGDYLPADQQLESAYQAKAPYALLSWDHMSGAKTFKIYKYEEGQGRASAQQLAEFSVDTTHLCQGNHCACQDRGAEVKDVDGNYKKFHYFVAAEGPGGIREFDFPSSAAPAATQGYQLNCSNLTQESIYLSPSCDNNNPGVDVFLKSAVPANIASYWNGKDSKLVVAGGDDSITAEGSIIGDSNGIADDQGGATQIGASAISAISWSVPNNFIDTDCAVTPCSLSLWVKFNQTATPPAREAIFFDKAATETSSDSLSSFLRLSREQFGLWQTASKSIDDGLIKAVNSSNQTQDTAWHHLKANWFNDGGSKKMKLWFDFNLVAESLDAISSFKLKDPIEQRRVYLGGNISDLATTEAIVDEVYLGEDAGNNPYYYEIFRKGPADTKYKYVATLDSNAFLWSESVFSNNLIAGQAYAYKIRVNSTQSNLTSLIIDPQGSLGDNQVKLATDCNVPSGPGPFNLHSSSVLCDELGNAQIELVWYDTKKPTQADNNYQIKVYRQLAAGQNIFYNFELSPDQSIPDAGGNYCKTEEITDLNAQIECHYYYTGASFAEYDFQVFRQLESDEAGFPDSAIAYLSDVATAKCYSEDPTDFSLSALIGCCSDGASCVDGGQAAAVSLTWQDADYTGKYAVYRDCNSENIADCSTLVREVYDSDICVGGEKNGVKCLIDTDCPGGSCGPAAWQIIDSEVGFAETHTYQVFAIGKSNKPDNSPDKPVTTPTLGVSGCFFVPTQPEILNIKRSCFGGAATHEIRWDYAESYGQDQATLGDPNSNIEIDYWVVYARENGSDFNQLLGVINAPPSVSGGYPFRNTLLSANNTYNYKIYAVDTNDIWSEGSLPWSNPIHPGEDVIAPICTNPPRKDLKNLRIIDYSQCAKITFQFDIDSQSIPPDDLAEGYEFYRLADSPDLTNYYYSNCQYDANETLGCNYSNNCSYSSEECAVYYKNKKISDQIAHGLEGSQLINIQSRNLTSYIFSDSAFIPGQTYFWAATSYNSLGYSTSTADNIFDLASGGFQTRQCAQSPEKSNVTAIAKCPATVILSWLNPADSSVTYYNIYRRRLEDVNFTLVKEKQEACVNEPEATEDCRNTYEDMPGALTDVYKYRIVSVNSQQIEVDGVPTIFYVEGDYAEKNARACFKLPRWQELPGITP